MFALLRDAQMPYAVLDIGGDHLPVEGGIPLPQVLQSGITETHRHAADGEVAWRVAHSDVVTEAELVGGRLVLTSFAGEVRALDPLTGRGAG